METVVPKLLSLNFATPLLTRRRIIAAYTAAVVTDGLQLVLGPLGWAGGDEVLDVAATLVETWLLGFHPLLLPTFVVEFLPVADLLPTWTGCVALVVALRKRQQHAPEGPPSPTGPIIDV
jgi:hypothetical protein